MADLGSISCGAAGKRLLVSGLVSVRRLPLAGGGLEGRLSQLRCFWLLPLGLIVLTGCQDGPLLQLKRLNPVFQRQWKADAQLGPTYYARRAELEKLQQQIAGMPTERRRYWQDQLRQVLEHDPSPELRYQAVLAAAKLPPSEGLDLLQRAAADEVAKVRQAACRGLADRTDLAATETLARMAIRDNDTSIRAIATRSLGGHPEAATRTALTQALEDRSPVVQLAATEALGQQTGLNLAGNVAAWKEYLDGNAAPLPESEGGYFRWVSGLRGWRATKVESEPGS
jgi:HEAT repeat protein